MTKTEKNKYFRRISKLACGKSVIVPGYAIVKAYRCPKTSKRAFSISGHASLAGGNLSMRTIKSDLESL